jgi:hypothetical protein
MTLMDVVSRTYVIVKSKTTRWSFAWNVRNVGLSDEISPSAGGQVSSLKAVALGREAIARLD